MGVETYWIVQQWDKETNSWRDWEKPFESEADAIYRLNEFHARTWQMDWPTWYRLERRFWL